jgi:hypothetical protein
MFNQQQSQQEKLKMKIPTLSLLLLALLVPEAWSNHLRAPQAPVFEQEEINQHLRRRSQDITIEGEVVEPPLEPTRPVRQPCVAILVRKHLEDGTEIEECHCELQGLDRAAGLDEIVSINGLVRG